MLEPRPRPVGSSPKRAARVEALVVRMPVLDRPLAEPPAQPDRAAAEERREVDQPRRDVAQRDVHLDQAGHAGLHLVDQALHPEAQQADLLGGARRRCLVVGRGGGDHAVAERDQLLPLVAQRDEDSLDLGHGGVGLIDRVVARHPPILGDPML